MFKNKALLFSITVVVFLSACSSTSSTNPNSEKDNEAVETSTNNITSAPDAFLQKMDEGKQVKLLQQALNKVGYDLEVNGIYDETTTWAITDFQLQNEELMATGVYDEDTEQMMNQFLKEDKSVEPGKGLPFAEEATSDESDTKVLSNPYDVLAVVNKEFALPESYEPEDLVTPNVRFPFTEELPKKQMRKVAADALEKMFKAADKEELELYAQSGYRSYDRQKAIFASNVEQNGEEEANIFSARPGESEHQSGLTMDVTSPEVNFDLIIEFGETPEGKWIKEHAAEYGFIIRYPEGREDITKYQYEPWHLRYVGEKAAKEIMENDLTLEEYILKN
ncbi:carboxypeptidase [Bacilli bacterium]|uniref:D-alanyl-D-alanine carboxypeptidase family protein n=1 Tax=Oceanobacillus sp. FSL K6-0118 TaxID=2921418 RepID=UPI000621FB81|nr:carboxypeptidase [Bacilli bacterium VT-13-104]PZD83653.1 carboxypeptidase [Bacilli bacterium]PZD84793.1 carboxypeptidase [Bacilli bacterium]PZD87130.1 carboxypeptidase [Bacilli bacterium]RCO05428.1 carboxypeptidase [Bacilli bacterium]